jgi:hypothetical protein
MQLGDVILARASHCENQLTRRPTVEGINGLPKTLHCRSGMDDDVSRSLTRNHIVGVDGAFKPAT